MVNRRLEKMNGLIKEAVSEILLYKSKDPRLNSLSITEVKVTADLKKAHVLYSHLGGDAEKEAVKNALEKARGFVRSALSERLNLRYTPEVRFEFDRNLEYAHHINDVLRELKPESIAEDESE